MMDVGFAVFNLNKNQAGKKANADTIKRFGMKKFQQTFPALYRNGIMSIFSSPETPMLKFWALRVQFYVNGGEWKP